jgi:hypothetical protein
LRPRTPDFQSSDYHYTLRTLDRVRALDGRTRLAEQSSTRGVLGQDRIDVVDIPFASQTTFSYQSSGDAGGVLTVGGGINSVNLGQYTAASFSLTGDGDGGTIVTGPRAAGGRW